MIYIPMVFNVRNKYIEPQLPPFMMKLIKNLHKHSYLEFLKPHNRKHIQEAVKMYQLIA